MRARKRRKSKSGITLRVSLSAKREARRLFGDNYVIFPREYRAHNPEGDSAGRTVYGYIDWTVGVKLKDEWDVGRWATNTKIACYGRGRTPAIAIRNAMWNMVLAEQPDITYEHLVEVK